MEKQLVDKIDEAAGTRGRSEFVRLAVIAALEGRNRLALIRSTRGSISSVGHDWDEDPARWVRSQRRGDDRRIG